MPRKKRRNLKTPEEVTQTNEGFILVERRDIHGCREVPINMVTRSLGDVLIETVYAAIYLGWPRYEGELYIFSQLVKRRGDLPSQQLLLFIKATWQTVADDFPGLPEEQLKRLIIFRS
jgi:hypothetical protein